MEEEEKEGRFKRRRMMEQRPGCMRRPCSGGAATGTSRRFLRRRGAGEWLPDARPVSWSSLVGRFMKLNNQLGFFTPESPFGSGDDGMSTTTTSCATVPRNGPTVVSEVQMEAVYIQGGPSGCSLPFVDIITKVPSQYTDSWGQLSICRPL